MERPTGAAEAPGIASTTPRAFFAGLLAGALAAVRVRPSPLATAYLIDLLEARVLAAGPEDPDTLAEALLAARSDRGPARVDRLRSLGDRALFVSGFFADRLERQAVGRGYYAAVGRSAYGHVATALSGRRAARALFAELAGHFGEYAEVLTEVGDRTASDSPGRLLGIFGRYLDAPRPADLRRLVRRGCLPPDPRSGWQ
jgi:hypothetical protein